MGYPKIYANRAEKQRAYRRRVAAKGKTLEELAYKALEELHRELRDDAASGDNDRARFAAVALGRNPLESVIKVLYYADICDPMRDSFGDYSDGEKWEEALSDEARRDYFRAKGNMAVTNYLNLSQDNIQLKLKWWDERPEG